MQRRFRRSVRRKLCNENLLQEEILGRRGSSAAGPGPAGTCLFVGWERFDLKDAVLTTFMVLSGISGILRSLDREKARQDRDEDRDERTRYNTYRSRPSRSGCCFA